MIEKRCRCDPPVVSDKIAISTEVCLLETGRSHNIKEEIPDKLKLWKDVEIR